MFAMGVRAAGASGVAGESNRGRSPLLPHRHTRPRRMALNEAIPITTTAWVSPRLNPSYEERLGAAGTTITGEAWHFPRGSGLLLQGAFVPAGNENAVSPHGRNGVLT